MDRYISKVTDYMSTGEGLSMWLLTYTASLLAGYKCCIGLIFVSVILDAVWGVASVKKRKAFVLSTLMRKTIKKLGGYFSVVLVFYLRRKGDRYTSWSLRVCGRVCNGNDRAMERVWAHINRLFDANKNEYDGK